MDAMAEFSKALESEIKTIDETLLPLLKEYLNSVRDVRMGLGREVKDILQSSRELTELTKTTSMIINFTQAVVMLKQTLTPETTELLRKITNNDK